MSRIQLRRRVAAHWLALQVGAALTLASLRIRTTPRDRLVVALGEVAPPRPLAATTPTPAAPPSLRTGRRVGRMVQRVARLLPWHPNCLPQALATQWLLQRRSIPSVLHLGIADTASMDAHAWVTVGNAKVVGRMARPYTPVASFER